MQVKINVNGAELTVSVGSVDEVAALVEAMKKGSGGTAVSDRQGRPETPPPAAKAPLYPNHIEEPAPAPADALAKVIDELTTAEVFKYLTVLAQRGDWVSDDDIRRALNRPPGANLGPPLATLSLTCGRHGVVRQAVLIKRVRSRTKNGRANYDYKLTDAAKSLVESGPAGGLPLDQG